jgi:hypothetical protein
MRHENWGSDIGKGMEAKELALMAMPSAIMVAGPSAWSFSQRTAHSHQNRNNECT